MRSMQCDVRFPQLLRHENPGSPWGRACWFPSSEGGYEYTLAVGFSPGRHSRLTGELGSGLDPGLLRKSSVIWSSAGVSEMSAGRCCMLSNDCVECHWGLR